MIKQIFSSQEFQFERLTPNCYTRKLKSNFNAYQTKYDFCRFYEAKTDSTKAIICMFNSSMLVATIDDVEFDDEFINDLITFIQMNKPTMVEVDRLIAQKLQQTLSDDYDFKIRTEYEYDKKIDAIDISVEEKPKLDDIFCIVKIAFPALADTYDLWITDTSHRIRRDQAWVYSYKNASTLMVKYIIDGYALIGQVGTLPEARGKNYARELLYYTIYKMQKQGIRVCLFAREKMFSFYEELGFTPVLMDLVLERKTFE